MATYAARCIDRGLEVTVVLAHPRFDASGKMNTLLLTCEGEQETIHSILNGQIWHVTTSGYNVKGELISHKEIDRSFGFSNRQRNGRPVIMADVEMTLKIIHDLPPMPKKEQPFKRHFKKIVIE